MAPPETPTSPVIPEQHARFLAAAVPRLAYDARIVGVAAGGSYVTGNLDEFSDLDLVIAVEPDAHAEVMRERPTIAAELGTLLVAFTGEHVGEPRLLVCLYGTDASSLLHVDLKFVRLPDAAKRVEDPIVLWARDERFAAELHVGTAQYPAPDLQAIEDRFWVVAHYVATKAARGEVLEAVAALDFLRYLALGPMALRSRAARPTGVRRLEQAAPDLALEIARTVAPCAAAACFAALELAIDLYRRLRAELESPGLRHHTSAEHAVRAYVHETAARLFPAPDLR